MSVVPSMMALMPLPLPPPDTLILIALSASMMLSAAAWAMGRTVVDPFMTSSAPKAAPDRAVRTTRERIAASFLMFKKTSVLCFLISRGLPRRMMQV